jgi:pimeloyl-ACP methyl ester carboxylesterase
MTTGATQVERKRRSWPVAVLASVAVLSTSGLAALLAVSGPGVGHFRSPEGREAYVAAYTAALSSMPEATESRDVSTSFGTVRAYAWVHDDPVDDLPVVLLPGRSSGVPMWSANLPDFAAHRTVYAFDPLGDAGLSAQSIPLRDMDDNARWVAEALAGLDLDRVHLVGHSQGGGLAAAVAVRHPGRLASLTLLEPIQTLGTIPAWAFGWSALASLPGVPQAWRDHALNRIGGVEDNDVKPDDPLARMIAAGSEHFESGSLPTPSPLRDDELRALSMPVYVALASEKSLAGDGAADKAEQIPRVRVRVLPETTHSLPMQAGAALDAELEKFWQATPTGATHSPAAPAR